jgi:hypothetical protein
MHREVRRHLGVDRLEELEELLTPMPSMTFADHLAGRDIERREERGRAVAPVVVRPALRRAERHRQHRRRAVEGLDLTLLVDAQDQGPIRGRQIEADDVAHFVDEERVAREFEGLTPMRLQAEGAPNAPDRRVTDIELLRQRPRTQWVASRGVASNVSVITCSTCASLSRRGVPGRGSSTNPSSRCCTKRCRQRPAVCRVIRNSKNPCKCQDYNGPKNRS